MPLSKLNAEAGTGGPSLQCLEEKAYPRFFRLNLVPFGPFSLGTEQAVFVGPLRFLSG